MQSLDVYNMTVGRGTRNEHRYCDNPISALQNTEFG